MDFTLEKYSGFLRALLDAGYSFVPYCVWMDRREDSPVDGRIVILRHDVDSKPGNSLATARIECSLGIRASYYFRAVPQSWDEIVIREISSLGHETGYHYESLTTCAGDVDRAYGDFCMNLERLKGIVPVRTICMHGSPRSPWDSRNMWKKYDYKSLGIAGEPYLDTDWSEVFYLTDTGRCWDGSKFSVRDKIHHWQDIWNELGLTFHSTDDIIRGLSRHVLPQTVMITTHPQRWMPFGACWLEELLVQNTKNLVKGLIAKSSR